MEKKMVKMVVYASGYNAGEVPAGCPKEYRRCTLADRMAFAEWLRINGQQYYLGEKEGVVYYTYKPSIIRYDVAVVEVDISRPWMFYQSDYDGSERILCFKNCTEFNEVFFKWIPFCLNIRDYLGLSK